MHRFATALAAACVISAPAAATTYAAKSGPATAQSRTVAGGVLWQCAGGWCRAATEESRPSLICRSLAKQIGRIDGFMVDGRAMAAGDLARCNEAAKALPTQADANR